MICSGTNGSLSSSRMLDLSGNSLQSDQICCSAFLGLHVEGHWPDSKLLFCFLRCVKMLSRGGLWISLNHTDQLHVWCYLQELLNSVLKYVGDNIIGQGHPRSCVAAQPAYAVTITADCTALMSDEWIVTIIVSKANKDGGEHAGQFPHPLHSACN